MPVPKELKHTMLRNEYNPKLFKFKSTEEIQPSGGIIGQERAARAMEFGFKINTKGYNLYVAGLTGIGENIVCMQLCRRNCKSSQNTR